VASAPAEVSRLLPIADRLVYVDLLQRPGLFKWLFEIAASAGFPRSNLTYHGARECGKLLRQAIKRHT